ncbi:MAG: xylanase [Muribaculaceae bacterium]|nr:xylanase [Muribaculaceae bacterium]
MKTILSILTLGLAAAAQGQTLVTINENETFQTIDNFAASDCWNTEYVGRYFSNANREKVARWLFSTETDAQGNPLGIGLTAWRVNLGAGSTPQGDGSGIDDETRRVDCFLQADGTYDWSRCPGQQYFMAKAKEYGVKDFVLFSNSAPVYYTKNGKALCDNGTVDSNLKDECYDDFAEFLATSAKHFADLGYNITHISPVNEPSWEWTDGQEGSSWSNTSIARLTRELDKSITSRNLDTKIMIPEAAAYNVLFDPYGGEQIKTFFDPESSDYVGNLKSVDHLVGSHSYWTVGTNMELQYTREAVRQAADLYNLKVYQTEWSMLENAPSVKAGFPEGGYDAATHADIALYMAKIIQSDLIYANVASWSYWTATAREQWGHKNRFYLIRLNAAGETSNESYSAMTGSGKVTDDVNMWTLGNFSRFIRPGYKRIGMTGANDLNGLLGSTYLSPDGKQLVCVIVNMGHDTKSINLNAGTRDLNGYTINKYVTDATHKLSRDTSLPTTHDGRAIEIAPRSTTTITLDKPETSLHGDVNGDNTVDISDLNILVNIILGTDKAENYGGRAYVSGGTSVDIADVNALLNLILY